MLCEYSDNYSDWYIYAIVVWIYLIVLYRLSVCRSAQPVDVDIKISRAAIVWSPPAGHRSPPTPS